MLRAVRRYLLLVLGLAALGAWVPAPAKAQFLNPSASATDTPADKSSETAAPAPVLAPRPEAVDTEAGQLNGRSLNAETLKAVRAEVQRLPLEIDRLQKAAARLDSDSEAIQDVRVDAGRVAAEARATIARIEPRLGLLREQLDALGPQPKVGDIPETETIASERTELTRLIAELTSAQKNMRLIAVRANQLLNRLQTTRHSLLARDLFERGDSPLSAKVWTEVSSQFAGAAKQLATVLTTWGNLLADDPVLLAAAPG
ncbi:MAG: DUF3772 domain-containing protein [Pseudomonadota bacterium]